jgi:excisionase family DNA binding protein
MSQLTQPVAYTMAEACELLGGISRTHLYTLIDRGDIRRVKLGRRSLIPASEIERLRAEWAQPDPAA